MLPWVSCQCWISVKNTTGKALLPVVQILSTVVMMWLVCLLVVLFYFILVLLKNCIWTFLLFFFFVTVLAIFVHLYTLWCYSPYSYSHCHTHYVRFCRFLNFFLKKNFCNLVINDVNKNCNVLIYDVHEVWTRIAMCWSMMYMKCE